MRYDRMILTDKQNKGLKIAVQRYKSHEPYTCIAGYAGSGKSTLVKYIIDELHLKDNDIAYVAYTGRASLILKQKGCPGATTAHRLLYHTKELPDGTFIHTPKDKPDKPLKLVVVDEISMLEKEQWDILMRWRVPVIALGDPFQLPPINESNGVLDRPHIFLDEIVRQATDSSIIRLSMDVREGKFISFFKDNDARVVPKDTISDRLLLGADMVLCGKNVTRHFLNARMRKAIWQEQFTQAPIEGDKCICLRNYWNYGDLTNGTIGTIKNINLNRDGILQPQMNADFVVDGCDSFEQLNMDHKLFMEGKETVNKDNWMLFPKEIRPMTFDYANAITVHKSQGGEYGKVVVFNEYMGDEEFWRRWLYTAVTRASEKLVVAM